MKRIIYIKSDNNYDASQLVLSLRVGTKHFGFSISNNKTGELEQLCWYTADEWNEALLEEVYHTYPELKKTYHKTIIGFDNPSALLVPDRLYKKEFSSSLLQTMYSEHGDEFIIEEPVSKWQLRTVYTVSGALQERLQNCFPDASIHHAYAVGINQLNDVDAEGNLYVDFRAEDFSVLAAKGNTVLLFQTFSYANPADVVYYLLKICQEFSLDPNTIWVTISGLLEKKSALYVEIYWYFMNVRFREANWQMPANMEAEYPSHFFTFFNDLSLCES